MNYTKINHSKTMSNKRFNTELNNGYAEILAYNKTNNVSFLSDQHIVIQTVYRELYYF